jgi:hypothetical protein
VVGVPDLGFLFPAFDERSADIHKVDYFIRDAKDSHSEFVSDVLGCGPKRTAFEQRKVFSAIVKKAYGADDEQGQEALIGIQESFNNRIETEEAMSGVGISVTLDAATIDEVLDENGIEGEPARIIKEVVLEEFADELPDVANLIDNKELEKNAKEREKKELVKEVASLKTELKRVESENITGDDVKNYDVVVRVKP